jgi:SAM-dependent methyltransferase
MNEYILPHHLAGEKQRLELMSQLLDPLHRGHIEQLGLQPGWRCLEVGCGNGSISKWLASRVAPGGHVVASDLDLRYIAGLTMPNLEIRQINILEDEVEEVAYDLVTARAMLHHVPAPERAVRRMLAALKPGGVFLSIEPDFLPATAAAPDSMHAFWQGWLEWSASVGIDYFIGRKMPSLLAGLNLEAVAADGHTALYNGGSPWAIYWIETLKELSPRLIESGHITESLLSDFNRLYADPAYWTSAITFIAVSGRKAAGAQAASAGTRKHREEEGRYQEEPPD